MSERQWALMLIWAGHRPASRYGSLLERLLLMRKLWVKEIMR